MPSSRLRPRLWMFVVFIAFLVLAGFGLMRWNRAGVPPAQEDTPGTVSEFSAAADSGERPASFNWFENGNPT